MKKFTSEAAKAVPEDDPSPASITRAIQICVRHLMTRPAVIVSPQTRVEDALRISDASDVHFMPVVHHDDLVGVVCVCELVDAPAGAEVAAYMSTQVAALPFAASAWDAVTQMDAQGVTFAPVHCDGWGVVTTLDLERAGVIAPRRCAACRFRHHLRLHPRYEDQWICDACLEVSMDTGELAELYRDVGGG